MNPAKNNLKISLVKLENNKETSEFNITKNRTILGRIFGDILINDSNVSTRHAELSIVGHNVTIKDLKSTNGTYVNGKQITKKSLKNYDELIIGETKFKIIILENLKKYKEKKIKKETKTKITSHKNSNLSKLIEDELKSFSRWDLIDEQDENVSFSKSLNLTKKPTYIKILRGKDKGKIFKFIKNKIIIGRGDADLYLNDLDISRKHALIEIYSDENIYIRDLASTNGTYINNAKIIHEKIKKNDIIQIGNTILKLEAKINKT